LALWHAHHHSLLLNYRPHLLVTPRPPVEPKPLVLDSPLLMTSPTTLPAFP
jgi:hypothetical protein